MKEEQKRKGLSGLRLHQANERLGQSERLSGFPKGCEEGRKPGVQRLLDGRPRAGSSPPAPRLGRTRNGSRSQCPRSPPLGRRGVWESQTDGSGSQKVTRWLFYDSGGKSHQPRGCLPSREGERWFPSSPLSLTETKTRLHVSANSNLQKSFQMDFQMGGGTNVNLNLGSHIKMHQISTRFVLWATGSPRKVLETSKTYSHRLSISSEHS